MKEQKDRYEIFLKVCETGSFSKAAEALNYTQSGISQMMAGLEEELGVQLFARVKRGVSLTDPYIGKAGEISCEPEIKAEVTVFKEKVDETIEAIKKVHPYEEPVINVIPIWRTSF